jgi:tape measure domain-containing protein
MATPLQLVIEVTDKGTPVIKGFAGQVNHAAQAMNTQGTAAATKMHAATGKLSSGLGLLKTAMVAVGTAAAAMGLAKLTGDIVSIASKMQGLERAMVAAAGSAQGGAKAMEFVRAESSRLGLELTSAAGAYKGLLAATVQAGKSASDAQLIFTGVAEAATAMGLSAEQTEGTLLAVQQIMAKGKLTAEELQGQLGERFPAAVGVMAKALGVSTSKLLEMMQAGEVTAAALIPFAQRLHKEFGPQAAAAANDWPAVLNRLKNAITEAGAALGKAGFLQAATTIGTGLLGAFKRVQESGALEWIGRQVQELATGIVDGLGRAYDWFARTVPPLWEQARVAVETFAGFMLGPLNDAWNTLKTQAGEANGVLSSLRQTWEWYINEGGPSYRDSLGALGDSFASTFGVIYQLVGGLEGAWASFNILFNQFIQLMIGKLMTLVQAVSEFFTLLREFSGFFGPLLAPLTQGFDGILGKISGVQDTLKGLRGVVQQTQSDWEQKLQDTQRGYTGLDTTIQNVGTAAVSAAGLAQKAAQQAGEAAQDQIEKTRKVSLEVVQQTGSAATQIVDKTGSAIVKLADGTYTNIRQGAAAAVSGMQEDAEKSIFGVAGAAKELGTKMASELKAAAEKGLQSFQTLMSSGQYTTKQLAALWPEVRERIIAAYGEIPPAFKALDERMLAGAQATANGIAGAYEGASARIQEALTFAQRRALEVQETIDNNILNKYKFAPIETKFGSTKGELEQQLADQQRFRTQVQRSSYYTGDLKRTQLANIDAAIAAITEKLQALTDEGGKAATSTEKMAKSVKTMREETERTTSGSRSMSANMGRFRQVAAGTPGAIPGYVPIAGGGDAPDGSWWLPHAMPGGIVAMPSQEAQSSRGTSAAREGFDLSRLITNMPKGGKLLGGSSLAGGPTIKASSYVSVSDGPGGSHLERRAAGAYRTRQGELLSAGAGEMLLDRSTADGLRALVQGQLGGGGVTITNPKFEVNISGVDPHALDAKGLMRALLPALREELRRSGYDVARL